MRKYFQHIVRAFANRHGVERGQAFAAKLLRDGLRAGVDPFAARRTGVSRGKAQASRKAMA